MKERPILFSAPMVRAILECRKTMTRRVVKPQPDQPQPDCDGKEPYWYVGGYRLRQDADNPLVCKFGQVGDRLWVRETWTPQSAFNGDPGGCSVEYRADGDVRFFDGEHGMEPDGTWRPSMFMPRWASRITLEITSVRVERLNEISEADAMAEGVDPLFTESQIASRPELAEYHGRFANYLWHGHHGRFGMGNKKSDSWKYQYSAYDHAADSFSSLWESINGEGSWAKNEWVWVVGFKHVEGGVK